MFTWICPQCGREVPPAYNECPDCAERAKQAAAAQPPLPQPPPQQPLAPPQQQPQPVQPVYAPPPQAPQQQQYYAPPQPPPVQPQYAPPPPAPQPPQYAPQQPQQQYAPPPPPQQQYAPPPQYAPPQQPQYAPPPPPQPQYQQHPPERRVNMPIWLMTILFAVATVGVVGGVVWLLSSNNKGSAGSGPGPSASVESPAAKSGAKTNPLQKYIEVSGVRFVADPKGKTTMAKFVIINHSDSEIAGLTGNVTIWGRTQKSEEDAQGTFSFSTNLGALETQELTVPLKTKLKIYELPDWQNITTDVQITGPGA